MVIIIIAPLLYVTKEVIYFTLSSDLRLDYKLIVIKCINHNVGWMLQVNVPKIIIKVSVLKGAVVTVFCTFNYRSQSD